MEHKPFFSVIIPTYNRAHLIGETLRCVLAQTCPDFEILLIDDASTDPTEAVVKAMADPRIRYIKNAFNLERSASRNKGIENAKGSYICFCDSDDHWVPGHLALIKQTLENHAFQDAFYFTGMTWCFPDRKQEVIFPPPEGNQIEYVIKHQIGTPTTCFSRTILDKHKFNTNLNINEDVELFARIVTEYPLIRIPVSTVNVQINNENTKALSKDYITPQIKAMEIIFGNPKLKTAISEDFKKERRKSLAHQQIQYLATTQNKAALRKKSLAFILRYPTDTTLKEKLVFVVYNLPGGRFIQSLIRSLKR